LHYRALVDLLVIGGSGLLGRRITRQAQLAGHRVIATFHANAPSATGVDWRRLDIRCRDDVTVLALDTTRHAPRASRGCSRRPAS
jgi:dTDP-4-dehydrorhamnose reductase